MDEAIDRSIEIRVLSASLKSVHPTSAVQVSRIDLKDERGAERVTTVDGTRCVKARGDGRA